MTAEFDEWVAARGPGLLRLAYVLTGNRADAEDAVQDALARALPRWDHIRSVGDPDAYVRRMVVNAHTSWWRKFRKRETPVAEAFVPEAQRATTGEDQDRVWRACLAAARGPARGRGAALLRTARVRRDRRPDRRRRGQRPLARLPRPRRAARRRSERSTTMTDFEDRLTSALRSAGDDAPDATGPGAGRAPARARPPPPYGAHVGRRGRRRGGSGRRCGPARRRRRRALAGRHRPAVVVRGDSDGRWPGRDLARRLGHGALQLGPRVRCRPGASRDPSPARRSSSARAARSRTSRARRRTGSASGSSRRRANTSRRSVPGP